MKLYKYYILTAGIFLLLVLSVFAVSKYINFKKISLLSSNYKAQSLYLNEKLQNEILRKKESTRDIAISLANNKDLSKRVAEGNIPTNYYTPLIKKLKNNRLYKNIWIQIIDKDGISVYKSWGEKNSNKVIGVKENLKKRVAPRKYGFFINIGKSDLTFKTIAPIYDNNIFLGTVEIISHFNSISENLEKLGIQSIIVASKNDNKEIKHPFNKLFVGKYYIANSDAPSKLKNYLNNNESKNGYIIVSHPIQNSNLSTIGYYVMFQKLKSIKNKDLDLFFSKLFFIITIVFMLLVIIGIITFIILGKKQRQKYKNIIDSSTNIMIINDSFKIVEANKAFFKVFNKYKTIEEFRKEHEGIYEFFVKGDGYLQKNMDNQKWLAYLMQNQNDENKVKIDFYGKIYYFLISASLINEELNQYCTVLTDITKQELYKIELESMTITDALTRIKNRRYFQTRIEEEINSVKRYDYPLSLIMADIDHFKKINDKFGHLIGDEVLKEYTKVISLLLRKEDTFCRVGGEEFIIILPHVNLQNAIKIAEKLRVRVQFRKEIVPITMSFGVAQYLPDEKIEHLYSRVDKALYRAKKEGRNTVVAAT